MATMKLTLTFKDNTKKTYTLKTIENLADIDPNKESEFLFNNLQMYTGYSNGKVDDEGYFEISHNESQMISAFPVKRLLGWRYKRKSSKKQLIKKNL